MEVRDVTEADIPLVLDYWFRSPPGFVEGLGVDLAKLPSEVDFAENLRRKIEAAGARFEPKEAPMGVAPPSGLNSLIILHDNRPVGMHTLNPWTRGDSGIFHAHIWDAAARGRGIGVRSYPLACRVFMTRFELRRILFKTPAQNVGAVRVKEKLGIRYVGDEIVDFGVIKAGTLARVFELTREEAESL